MISEIKIPRSSHGHKIHRPGKLFQCWNPTLKKIHRFLTKTNRKKRRTNAAAMATYCILILRTIKFIIDMIKEDEVETLPFFSLVFALKIHWGNKYIVLMRKC